MRKKKEKKEKPAFHIMSLFQLAAALGQPWVKLGPRAVTALGPREASGWQSNSQDLGQSTSGVEVHLGVRVPPVAWHSILFFFSVAAWTRSK